MITLLGFVVAWTAAFVGYKKARTFVRERLRYVEGVQKAMVPLKIGFIAAFAALPVAWIVPVITSGAAILFGTAVGFGVAAGRKDIRARRYLSA
jgi:amino acid transporter